MAPQFQLHNKAIFCWSEAQQIHFQIRYERPQFFITILSPPFCSSEGPESLLARGCCHRGGAGRRWRWWMRPRRSRSSPCSPSSSTPTQRQNCSSAYFQFSPLLFLLLHNFEHMNLGRKFHLSFHHPQVVEVRQTSRIRWTSQLLGRDQGSTLGPRWANLRIIYARSSASISRERKSRGYLGLVNTRSVVSITSGNINKGPCGLFAMRDLCQQQQKRYIGCFQSSLGECHIWVKSWIWNFQRLAS